MTGLKSRILFTIVIILLYRLGTYIPLLNIDPVKLKSLFEQNQGIILEMYDTFSGGALQRMSIFALGIMPYITASIIIQLLTPIVPYLRYLKNQGEYGRKMISGGIGSSLDNFTFNNSLTFGFSNLIKNKSFKWMFYIILISLSLNIVLNIVLNTIEYNKNIEDLISGIERPAKRENNTNILNWLTTLIESIFIIMYYIIINPSITSMVMFSLIILQSISIISELKINLYKEREISIQNIVKLIFGTTALVFLGELITGYGIGNGISLIIFFGIIAGFPGAIGTTLEMGRQGEISIALIIGLLLLCLALIGGVTFVESCQRKIPIEYAKRQIGKKIFKGQTSHLPLKINMAGVIPAIFASSLLFLPAYFTSASPYSKLTDIVNKYFTRGTPLYMITFFLLIFGFSYFYTGLVFDPVEMASNLKKSVAYIPGIRPGKDTVQYISQIVNRLTFFGGTYLGLVCLLPEFLISKFNVPFYLGSTSLLIVVIVAMDTLNQIQTHLMSNQYEALMKKAGKGAFKRGGIIQINAAKKFVSEALMKKAGKGAFKRGGIIQINAAKKFVSEALSELKKVTWPSKKEVTQTTLVILLFVSILTTFVFLVDKIYKLILKYYLKYDNNRDE
jgi:preprotein translocase SecY subunit/preprotein translocase SecE subunit